jgi:hypothetical protein
MQPEQDYSASVLYYNGLPPPCLNNSLIPLICAIATPIFIIMANIKPRRRDTFNNLFGILCKNGCRARVLASPSMATSQNLVTSMPTLSNISSNGDGSAKNENDKLIAKILMIVKNSFWYYTTPRTGTFCQIGSKFHVVLYYYSALCSNTPSSIYCHSVLVLCSLGSRVFSCTVPGKIVALQYIQIR